MTEPIQLTARQARRLLERWLVLQGTEAAAKAVLAVHAEAKARYEDEITSACDVPEGSQVAVDFAAGVVTVTRAEPTD